MSNHDEGALDFAERRLAGAIDPKPLDVLQLPLSAPKNNPLQPENWLIQPGQTWIKESALDAQALLPLIEEPESLWLQPGQRIDRVNPAFLQKLSHPQSLYLMVFVTEYTIKGTERSGQEYASPLLVLTGEEYARITFDELHRRICDTLRGNRSPVVAEFFLPGGQRKIIRGRKQK